MRASAGGTFRPPRPCVLAHPNGGCYNASKIAEMVLTTGCLGAQPVTDDCALRLTTMTYPHNHDRHHRQSTRLQSWDYTAAGTYSVTICTHRRQNLFEDAAFRQVAENAWQAIPTRPHAQHVTLDEWVLMPNHLHGILVIAESALPRGNPSAPVDNPGVPDARPGSQPDRRPIGPVPGSLGAIVGNYKSLVTRRVNNLRGTPGAPLWQRGFYDRIIRNERELNAIRPYIRDNPARWAEDRDNLDTCLRQMQRSP